MPKEICILRRAASVSAEELSVKHKEMIHPVVKDVMKSAVSEHPFIKPAQLAMNTRNKMTVLNAMSEVAKHMVLPMNNVIDFNHYPVPETADRTIGHQQLYMQ